MSQHVYVIGLDDFNARALERLPHANVQYLDGDGQHRDAATDSGTGNVSANVSADASVSGEGNEGVTFHPLLEVDRVKEVESAQVSMKQLHNEARKVLTDAPRVDGIMGYWDFPVQTMVPLLCREFDLPSSSLEGVLRCEHKLWSRLEQQRAADEVVPAFHAVDLFVDAPLAALEFDYPFWLKPIKGTDSSLSFLVENDQDAEHALEQLRQDIDTFAEPFGYLLGQASLPEEIAAYPAHTCLAEKPLAGEQCTVSGYVCDGKVSVYGIIDSLTYEGSSSFLCYRYPSQLPEGVQERMRHHSHQVMQQLEVDHMAFNIEFFYDDASDQLGLLEINPRISQSHGELYAKVDGLPNHKVITDLALGNTPQLPRGQGQHRWSAKYFWRHFEDAIVTNVPDENALQAIHERYAGAVVQLNVSEGMQLSSLLEQDSYSYDLAHIYVGAERPEDLHDLYEQIIETLEIGLKPVS